MDKKKKDRNGLLAGLGTGGYEFEAFVMSRSLVGVPGFLWYNVLVYGD